ncbi:MAG: DUF21 domain-containing protein, partial [Bacteroidota bacterium]|nr:DUF21 domain-containing protein [Bacteroidota bacterium]
MDEDPHQNLLFVTENVSTDLGLSVAFLVILVLLLFSALISGSDVAFFSLDASKWQNENESDIRPIKKLLKRPNFLLATILISNNFINVAIVIVSTFLTNRLFDFTSYPILSFFLQVIVVTFALLLMGEVIPKVYANQKSLGFAKLMVGPLTMLSILFSPLSKLLVF